MVERDCWCASEYRTGNDEGKDEGTMANSETMPSPGLPWVSLTEGATDNLEATCNLRMWMLVAYARRVGRKNSEQVSKLQ